MLNRLIILGCVLVGALILVLLPFPEGPVALVFIAALSVPAVLVLRKQTTEQRFITNLFLGALALRLGFGIFIHIFGFRDFFGGDARVYDANGAGWVDVWLRGAEPSLTMIFQNDPRSGAGWGMNYLTALIYLVVGRSIFTAQSFCAIVGAATAPLVYFCTRKIYNNLTVAKFAAISVAVFPSFVVWSGQLLKDGLVIFLLVAVMTAVMKLQEKFSVFATGVLVLSLFGILSLRFYIFYMVVVAVVGSLFIGRTGNNLSIVRSTVIVALIGLALAYFGVGRKISVELSTFVDLTRIQSSRADLAARAESGFGAELDVSTTEGAITTLPIGFTYLMLAPFPWQATNLRQAITIPEVLLWWAMFPLLASGLIYTIRNRLRNAFPILLFSLMLTLAYSIFQGNVGTAYRQRTQIQVFLFILIAVGFTVYREKRENARIMRALARRRLESHVRAGALANKF